MPWEAETVSTEGSPMARIVIEVPDAHTEIVGAVAALAEHVAEEINRAKGTGGAVDYASIERKVGELMATATHGTAGDPAPPRVRLPRGPRRDRNPR